MTTQATETDPTNRFARHIDPKDLLNSKEHAKTVSHSTLRKGNCSPGICGEEAACFPGENSTHRCICPSDLSAPTPDLHCPFRRTVPVSGKPFKISIPNPTEKSKAGELTYILITASVVGVVLLYWLWLRRQKLKRREQEAQAGELTYILVTASVVGVVLLYWLWLRRQKLKRREQEAQATSFQMTPTRVPRGAFINNPEYDDGSVPIAVLSKESLLFRDEIGEGFFGKVYKGDLLNYDGSTRVVAIKVLKDSSSPEMEQDFLTEAATMSSFKHENIIMFLGITCKESTKRTWMVFEYMPLGDLADLLRKNHKILGKLPPGTEPLSAAQLHAIALQIANGMKYLAANRFVHNDLACRNILVGTGNVVKIADFGMSRDIYMSDYYRLGRSKPLPLRWMSPESLMYRKFTFESDVWSYGVVLWEIYTLGKQPYFGYTNQTAMNLILGGNLLIPPSNCPFYIRELMAGCWKLNPDLRSNFDEIYLSLYRYYKARQLRYPKQCPKNFPEPEEYLEEISEEPPPGFPGNFETEFGQYYPGLQPNHYPGFIPGVEPEEQLQKESRKRENQLHPETQNLSVEVQIPEEESRIQLKKPHEKRYPLPRPPSFPVSPHEEAEQELLDPDNYLAPRPVDVHKYIETLPH